MDNYTEDKKTEMIELIDEYEVEYDGCHRSYCSECDFLNNCYHIARQREDSEWVKSINYGGYANEEEFWEELLN